MATRQVRDIPDEKRTRARMPSQFLAPNAAGARYRRCDALCQSRGARGATVCLHAPPIFRISCSTTARRSPAPKYMSRRVAPNIEAFLANMICCICLCMGSLIPWLRPRKIAQKNASVVPPLASPRMTSLRCAIASGWIETARTCVVLLRSSRRAAAASRLWRRTFSRLLAKRAPKSVHATTSRGVRCAKRRSPQQERAVLAWLEHHPKQAFEKCA